LATQWMDDFQGYGTDGSNVARMLNGPYAEASCSLVADPDPTAGGKFVLKMNSIGANIVRRVLSSVQTTVGVAARYWLSSIPGGTALSGPRFFQFSDTNNNDHIYVIVDASGYLEVFRNDSGGVVLLGTTSSPLTANSWNHIEIKIVFNAVTGSVQIRREGGSLLNITNTRTTSNNVGVLASCQNVTLRNAVGAPSVDYYTKDLIVWDGTGAVNNDFFGSCQVYRITPSADVSRNWNTTIGAAPIQSPVTTSTTGGTLAAGTYYYVVTAILNPQGESIASNEQSITTTGATSSNTITWAAPVGMTVTGYKIYRGTAAGVENVFYAPAGTATTFTDTNAASTGGTPPTDAGTGFNKINETTPDDDGTFITAGQGPYPAAYQASMTQLPNNVTSVRAVMTTHRSRKTDGGDGNVQASLISGANTGSGSNRAITTAYTYWSDMFETDPSGSNWNKTLVNALKLKLDRTL
jgi:hypothetical protein